MHYYLTAADWSGRHNVRPGKDGRPEKTEFPAAPGGVWKTPDTALKHAQVMAAFLPDDAEIWVMRDNYVHVKVRGLRKAPEFALPLWRVEYPDGRVFHVATMEDLTANKGQNLGYGLPILPFMTTAKITRVHLKNPGVLA